MRQPARGGGRRTEQAPPRKRRPGSEQRPAHRTGYRTVQRPGTRPLRPKSASQAKARAKARKAKAPKVVRPPLRVRLRETPAGPARLDRAQSAGPDLRVPFVVLVIAALGLGLAVTPWLSTGSAERSYQLGHCSPGQSGLLQQSSAGARRSEAQAAPALAESARNLGMIPSRDTAHLLDATGNWTVVGTLKPAEGVPLPPLNTPLPEEAPPAPLAPPHPGCSIRAGADRADAARGFPCRTGHSGPAGRCPPRPAWSRTAGARAGTGGSPRRMCSRPRPGR